MTENSKNAKKKKEKKLIIITTIIINYDFVVVVNTASSGHNDKIKIWFISLFTGLISWGLWNESLDKRSLCYIQLKWRHGYYPN